MRQIDSADAGCHRQDCHGLGICGRAEMSINSPVASNDLRPEASEELMDNEGKEGEPRC